MSILLLYGESCCALKQICQYRFGLCEKLSELVAGFKNYCNFAA